MKYFKEQIDDDSGHAESYADSDVSDDISSVKPSYD